MTAREMFEELGFRIARYGRQQIVYFNYPGFYVMFDLTEKSYVVDSYSCSQIYTCGIELRKAIHQQKKELGWLDE